VANRQGPQLAADCRSGFADTSCVLQLAADCRSGFAALMNADL
jgi:hypothetical protein